MKFICFRLRIFCIKKPDSTGFLTQKLVGMAGFEPTTPCTPSKCASQAALRSDKPLQMACYYAAIAAQVSCQCH